MSWLGVIGSIAALLFLGVAIIRIIMKFEKNEYHKKNYYNVFYEKNEKPVKFNDCYVTRYNQKVLQISLYLALYPAGSLILNYLYNYKYANVLINIFLGTIFLLIYIYLKSYKIKINSEFIVQESFFGVKTIKWSDVNSIGSGALISDPNIIDSFHIENSNAKISVPKYILGHKYIRRYARCRLKNVPHVRSL